MVTRARMCVDTGQTPVQPSTPATPRQLLVHMSSP